ncbi:hypothetical protein Tco_1507538 [Tanacetum coccineum]
MDSEVTDTSIQQNPEQTDEEFTTTAYPNLQENLKLPTKDQVRLEEPASSAGTLSVGEAQLTGPEIVHETTEKIVQIKSCLNPRYVGPFKVLERIGSVAYKLELSEELSRVYNTFHVSNLKKCYADEPLAVPLDGLHFDNKLQFVEAPVEIVDREVKRLRKIRVPIVKVRWNSRRGPEFTWEREYQFKKKYTHLFTKTAPSSSTVL